MPDEQTVKRARKARSEGKAPSTQAGDFVREEIHHVREGNTARAQASRRLPSGCLKQGEPASNFHHQKRAQHQRKLVSKPKLHVPRLAEIRKTIAVPDHARRYLERMMLDRPQTLKERLLQRAVVYALASVSAI